MQGIHCARWFNRIRSIILFNFIIIGAFVVVADGRYWPLTQTGSWHPRLIRQCFLSCLFGTHPGGSACHTRVDNAEQRKRLIKYCSLAAAGSLNARNSLRVLIEPHKKYNFMQFHHYKSFRLRRWRWPVDGWCSTPKSKCQLRKSKCQLRKSK